MRDISLYKVSDWDDVFLFEIIRIFANEPSSGYNQEGIGFST